MAKSSYSNSSGNCVDVWREGETVCVADTKLGAQSPVLRFTREEWLMFGLGYVDGEFVFDKLEERTSV